MLHGHRGAIFKSDQRVITSLSLTVFDLYGISCIQTNSVVSSSITSISDSGNFDLVGSRLKVVLKNIAKAYNIVCGRTCNLLIVLEKAKSATRTGLATVRVLALLIEVKLDKQRLRFCKIKSIDPVLRVLCFVVANLPAILVKVDCRYEETPHKI